MSNSAKVFYQEDCDLTLLYGKTIAVIGYGIGGDIIITAVQTAWFIYI